MVFSSAFTDNLTIYLKVVEKFYICKDLSMLKILEILKNIYASSLNVEVTQFVYYFSKCNYFYI